LLENLEGVLHGGARNKGGVREKCDFAAVSRYVSETAQANAKVTVEREFEVICDLSNNVISNDLGLSYR